MNIESLSEMKSEWDCMRGRQRMVVKNWRES